MKLNEWEKSQRKGYMYSATQNVVCAESVPHTTRVTLNLSCSPVFTDFTIDCITIAMR